mmetsp:Transcript_616/g.1045  ORF Transcript_616/g.1045 Transcript_616/m.1045 type:complete len:215 (+) Transcript_616:332-976(+)
MTCSPGLHSRLCNLCQEIFRRTERHRSHGQVANFLWAHDERSCILTESSTAIPVLFFRWSKISHSRVLQHLLPHALGHHISARIIRYYRFGLLPVKLGVRPVVIFGQLRVDDLVRFVWWIFTLGCCQSSLTFRQPFIWILIANQRCPDARAALTQAMSQMQVPVVLQLVQMVQQHHEKASTQLQPAEEAAASESQGSTRHGNSIWRPRGHAYET